MPPKAVKPVRRWPLASFEYAISTPTQRESLDLGRKRFWAILADEIEGAEKVIGPDYLSKWIVSEDLGRLVELWKAAMNKAEAGKGPALAHDILALHGVSLKGVAKKLRFYGRESVRDLMDPKEAYVLPVFDCMGRHLATVIHAGAEAMEEDVRKMVISLITDPTGAAAFEGF